MQDTTQADTGRQAGGHRQASSQTSRQTYWQAGGRLAGRDRQTCRQTQAGRQAVEHRRANSQTSKRTYWQTFTHAHGDVDKRKRNVLEHTQPHGSGLAAWGKTSAGIKRAQAQGQQHSSVLRTQTSMFSILHGARQGQAGKQAD